MAYTHQTTTEEHPMNSRLAAAAAATVASATLLMPATAHAAEEPTPAPDTCTTDLATAQAATAFWREEARYWSREADASLASELAAGNRMLAAEDRARDLAGQVAARTAERDQQLVRTSRQARTIARLQAKVAELRARLRQEPQS